MYEKQPFGQMTLTAPRRGEVPGMDGEVVFPCCTLPV